MGLEVVFDNYLVRKKAVPSQTTKLCIYFYIVAIIYRYIFFTGVNSCFEQKLEISS